MAYVKNQFVDGQVLTAECLNRMDSGIKEACDSAPPPCSDEDCGKVLSHTEDGHAWISVCEVPELQEQLKRLPVVLTQAEYDSLEEPEPDVLYMIVRDES